MSYRTYINGSQVFGNGEYYKEWIKFVKSQGIPVGEEQQYEGYLTDFMAAMDVVERIVMGIDQERRDEAKAIRKSVPQDDPIRRRCRSLFDLSDIYETVSPPRKDGQAYREELFDTLYDRVAYGYLFMPLMLYDACKELLELDVSHPSRFRGYRLKPGTRIHVKAG